MDGSASSYVTWESASSSNSGSPPVSVVSPVSALTSTARSSWSSAPSFSTPSAFCCSRRPLEHHLHVAVPHYNLPRMHRLLRKRGAFDEAMVLSGGYLELLRQASSKAAA